MSNFTSYTTIEGDTWANIAYRAYGLISEMGRIIDANPSVPITATLQGGIELVIPILPPEEATIPTSQLPPWKR